LPEQEGEMGKALAAWLLVAGAVASPVSTPREIVQSAVSRVLVVLQRTDNEALPASGARRMDGDQARAEIRRVAADLFDFDEISRRVLSRYWTERSAEEQAEFVRLFTDVLERTYIGRIEAYSGEKIVYVGETVDGPFATVRSKVVTRRRTETPLDYKMHLRDGRWKVYDILIDHVSFVSMYRSEFARVLQREPYTGLVERLRKEGGPPRS
jgi:phospholipid transport system substrate-binding protein